jgi:CheY-like chemotaxis protein
LKPFAAVTSLKVAVVDDESIALKQIGRILARHGYAVEVFENPIQALERMQSVAFNIVMTDIHMPQLSGMELLERVKSVTPKPKSFCSPATPRSTMRSRPLNSALSIISKNR